MDLTIFEQQTPAHNDFRSDTFTTPTASMIKSLSNTTLGDAVYNEDQATILLESKVAALAGKEAGLFCVSGTLSNQIGLRVNLLQPPHSVLCDYRAHVYVNEAGGLATLSQAMVQPIIPKNGIHLTLEDDILPVFITDDGEIHGAPTKVISLENTLGGVIFPLEEIKKISQFCKQNNVRLHLDGARLWNASVETGISIEEYCSYFDSVSLCLSKSLGAPIGSVLVGDTRFINKANHFRKQNGGGIRQSGLLASMAIVAVTENLPKIKRSHDLAKKTADFCKENGISLKYPVETNFVFLDLAKDKLDSKYLVEKGREYNVKISQGNRLAFHYQISDESFENLKKALLAAITEAKKNPSESASARDYY